METQKLKLALERPIVFIKIQTTGVDEAKDKIVEISLLKINPDGTEQTGTRLVNPGISIPKEVSELNGITDSMVADKPKFEEIAPKLFEFMKDSDLAGFNIVNFDLKFLITEFGRAGVEFMSFGRNIVDTSLIQQKMEPRDFRSTLARFTEHVLSSDTAISSQDNIAYSISLVNGMMEAYKGKEVLDGKEIKTVTDKVDELSSIFSKKGNSIDLEGKLLLNENKQVVLNFGKHKNSLLIDILREDPSWCQWVIEKSTGVSSEVKGIFKKVEAKQLASK